MNEIDFIQPKKTVGKLISVDVLDKIRAEIEKVFCMPVVTNELRTPMEVKTEILQIIDKYAERQKCDTCYHNETEFSVCQYCAEGNKYEKRYYDEEDNKDGYYVVKVSNSKHDIVGEYDAQWEATNKVDYLLREEITNGDIIKAAFPNMKTEDTGNSIGYESKVNNMSYFSWFNKDWWNSKYYKTKEDNMPND